MWKNLIKSLPYHMKHFPMNQILLNAPVKFSLGRFSLSTTIASVYAYHIRHPDKCLRCHLPSHSLVDPPLPSTSIRIDMIMIPPHRALYSKSQPHRSLSTQIFEYNLIALVVHSQ